MPSEVEAKVVELAGWKNTSGTSKKVVVSLVYLLIYLPLTMGILHGTAIHTKGHAGRVHVAGRHEGLPFRVIGGVQSHGHVPTHQVDDNEATLHLLAQIRLT